MVAEAFITGERLREHWQREGKWDYRTLAHLPTAHVAGVQVCDPLTSPPDNLIFSSQGYFVIPFYNGGTTYWMPKFDFVDFLAFNRSLAITTFFSVPPIFLLVTKSPLVKDHFRTLKAATGRRHLPAVNPSSHRLLKAVQRLLEGTCRLASARNLVSSSRRPGGSQKPQDP